MHPESHGTPPSGRLLRGLALTGAILALVAMTVPTFVSCGTGRAETGSKKKIIVLGFDGQDYDITKDMMARGLLPNFSRLADMGAFSSLETSVPPQSPVAWSNFITGMDAGGHGIFDFIHRDPKTMFPYLSTSRTEGSENTFKIGKYQIPLSGGKVELLRHGTPFWEVLEKHGVRTSIIRMPANFPPSGTASFELSGMGTPDIVGSYGTFSYYTSDYGPFEGKSVSGGEVYRVDIRDNVVHGKLYGPPNPFLVKPEKTTADFEVYVDPKTEAAMLVVGDTEEVLKVGEWTKWIPIEFDLIPTQKVPAIARFYLKGVSPVFDLYVSPLNMDPMSPAMPISTPKSYAADLAEATGRYYTQGMPEDTKGLTEGVLTPDEFLQQAHITADEIAHQYKWVLSRFHEGLLFYYFGDLDQVSHMMFRPSDPGHPAYDALRDAPYSTVVYDLYVKFDQIVGYTLDHMEPDTTLIVMSDHGFTSWRRSFNLNTWLYKNGYLALKDPNRKDDPGLFANVDWSRTKAYGLGLNGLYINLRGREKNGIVPPEKRRALVDEICENLLETIDPATGQQAITKAYKSEEIYKDRGYLDIGPDIQVGYAKGTRGSNESALGEIPPEVIVDNTEEWSGDHCMDHEAVPGILFTSHPLKKQATSLKNLAAAILVEFGIDQFPPPDES